MQKITHVKLFPLYVHRQPVNNQPQCHWAAKKRWPH